MQPPNDILENPNRRRYHVIVGLLMCVTIYTAVVIGVRIMYG